MKRFVKGFGKIHDAAKVETTAEYLKGQDVYLKKKEQFYDAAGKLKKRYIIEGLHEGFGVNPWKIPDDMPVAEKKRMLKIQNDIKGSGRS